MKISIPTRHFNNHGGISRCIWALSENYSKEHDVHVFSSRFDPPPFKITQHQVPSYSSPPFLAELSFASNAQKALDSFPSDIAYAPSSSCYKADVFTANSCHKAAIELFRKQRGLSYSILKAFEPKSRVVLDIEAFNYRKGNYRRITALSERVKREVVEHYGVPAGDITVVPPGVDTKKFKPSEEARRKLHSSYSIPSSVPILLFCGHEFKRKGLAQAISALGKVKKDFRLLVIGGDKREQYIELARSLSIQDKIIFAGFVKDISFLFNGSDIFVFPTAYEPYGMVITEALSSGMPVVTPEIAGAAELMAHGKDGYLLKDPFDTRELAGRLDPLLSDEKLRKKMGQEARKTALNYTWERISGKMMGVFQEAIELKSRR